MTLGKVKIRRDKLQLMIMAMAGICFLFVFAYLPMVGILLAFRDGNDALNIFRALLLSDWTWSNIFDLIGDKKFWDVFQNTIGLNICMLLINFPLIIFENSLECFDR